MTDFFIKQNNLSPALQAQLVDTPPEGTPGEDSPIDLAGAKAVFFIARLKTDKDPTPPQIKGECVFVDVSEGIVAYEWQEGDTEVPGEYNFEWEIVWTEGEKPASVPRKGYYVLDIEEDLDV